MTVTLELNPEIEARIREKAAKQGIAVEELIATVVENDVIADREPRSGETMTFEEWMAALDEFIQSSPSRNVTWTVDDSRESIYRDREDAQL